MFQFAIRFIVAVVLLVVLIEVGRGMMPQGTPNAQTITFEQDSNAVVRYVAAGVLSLQGWTVNDLGVVKVARCGDLRLIAVPFYGKWIRL